MQTLRHRKTMKPSDFDKLRYSGSEFKDIRERVDEAEALAAITEQTNNCFLSALLAAIEQPDKDLLVNVMFVIRNRMAGSTLGEEDEKAVDYIESFRKWPK